MAASLSIKLGFSLIACAAIATLTACSQTQVESSNTATAKTIKLSEGEKAGAKK